MKVELKRSYIFYNESVSHILEFLEVRTVGFTLDIQDNYLNPNLRIRSISRHGIHDRHPMLQLIRKSGDKNSGGRTEEYHNIDQETAAILISDTKLQIIKQSHNIDINRSGLIITLDIIKAPMKIAVLEIESTDNKIPPTVNQLFGKDLQECPLASWDFFRQKIGICGAPSSGKTETAKALSHLVNTRLFANSSYVPEYATSFIQKYDQHPNEMDQFMIWYSQRARENDAVSKANIVISDCPTFLSYIYMMFNNKKQMDDQFRIHLVKLYKRVLEDIKSYNHIIYLQPKLLIKNNVRFHSDSEIRSISNRIYAFLKWHNIPFITAEREDANEILKSIFFINETGR